MDKPKLTLAKGAKLPQFDMPVDFLVYDDISADLLKYYTSFPCKIFAAIFCYVVRGHIKGTVNLWDFDIKPNDFVIITPGSFIQVKEVSENAQVSFEGFSSSFLNRMNFWKLIQPLMLDIFKRPVFSLGDDLGGIYRDFFALMTRASVFDGTFQSTAIANSSMTFLVESLHNAIVSGQISVNSSHTSREQAVVSEFLQLAFENYRDEHKVTFYAREANLTLSHFCNVISRTTGLTPQEILMNMIIMDAKTQLKGTEQTVAKIAQSLGFSTPTLFNRYFRTYAGMTPLEYRNS